MLQSLPTWCPACAQRSAHSRIIVAAFLQPGDGALGYTPYVVITWLLIKVEVLFVLRDKTADLVIAED